MRIFHTVLFLQNGGGLNGQMPPPPKYAPGDIFQKSRTEMKLKIETGEAELYCNYVHIKAFLIQKRTIFKCFAFLDNECCFLVSLSPKFALPTPILHLTENLSYFQIKHNLAGRTCKLLWGRE